MSDSSRRNRHLNLRPAATSLFFLSLLLFHFFLHPVAGAEEAAQELKLKPPAHVVVVTAARLETPERETASSITIITREKIEAMNRTTVLEALQDVLGLSLQQNGPAGAAASVFIRGSNPEHVLVMVDGVEMNDPVSPTRMFDLAHLRLDDVERIEILRGPQSTLYGSEAMGGVIHVITRRGAGREGLRLSSLAGSFGTLSAGLGYGGKGKRYRYDLSSSWMKSDGFSAAGSSYPGNKEKDGCRSLWLSGRLGWDARENAGLELAASFGSNLMDLDNYGGAYGDDTNYRQNHDTLLLRGTLRSRHLENRWEQALTLSYVRHDRAYRNPEDEAHPFDAEEGTYTGGRVKLDWQHNLFLAPSHTLTAGLEIERESGKSDYVSQSVWGAYESLFPPRTAGSGGFYIQDRIALAGVFFATAGARVDRHGAAGTALTWRLAPAVLVPGAGTKIRASLGTGFKAPSLYQLYAPGTAWGPIGNVLLRPERSLGWDFGLEQVLLRGKLTAAAGVFFNSYRDLIQFDFLQGYSNIGRAETKGYEIEFRAEPRPWLSAEASYTRTKVRDLESGLDLLRRPQDKFSAGLRVASGSARLALEAVYVGSRDDLDYSGWEAQRVRLDPFLVLNASAALRLRSGVEALLRLDNILNRAYELVRGYGTAGFSVYAGLRIGS
ncbi:MAG: TonB-dependent receptor [Candidatus Aminicenantes bacterium]|nr:TonB-dependent receptor [Candidatus Aminicenantes bacterium]